MITYLSPTIEALKILSTFIERSVCSLAIYTQCLLCPRHQLSSYASVIGPYCLRVAGRRAGSMHGTLGGLSPRYLWRRVKSVVVCAVFAS